MWRKEKTLQQILFSQDSWEYANTILQSVSTQISDENWCGII